MDPWYVFVSYSFDPVLTESVEVKGRTLERLSDADFALGVYLFEVISACSSSCGSRCDDDSGVPVLRSH